MLQCRPVIESKIKEICEAQGIANAYQLWQRLVEHIPKTSKQTAYKLWDGTFKRIDRNTLEVLCRVLDCGRGPLELLTYTPDAGRRKGR